MAVNLLSTKVLTNAAVVAGLVLAASSASAAMKTDAHGNVGYDTYEECVAAIEDGSAKFYTPYTYQQPKRGAGEASVKKMRLSEVSIPQQIVSAQSLKSDNYKGGACDLGVGQSNGRYGVSGALVGKYVPIAADMPVNVYLDKKGNPVRLTMQQCDNHFSNKFPMPVAYTADSSEAPAPAPEIAIEESRNTTPVVIETNQVIRPSAQARKVESTAKTAVATSNAQPAVRLTPATEAAVLTDAAIDGAEEIELVEVEAPQTVDGLVEADADDYVIIE
ncbi:hypothetical protein [Psychrobacter ciconiae]|uniref:hypothetical protein n=1 Tax=Psychrobacter ciconiae TaxID=1553449 RepID=UPI00191A5F71|nr:hypothetical protein [Psychrobacter ciconiae]